MYPLGRLAIKLLSESLRRRKFIIWPPSRGRSGRRREVKGAERKAGWRLFRFARRLAGCRRRREQERCRCYVREPPRLLLMPPLPRLSRPPVSRWQPPKPLPPCLALPCSALKAGGRREATPNRALIARPEINGGPLEKPAFSRRLPSLGGKAPALSASSPRAKLLDKNKTQPCSSFFRPARLVGRCHGASRCPWAKGQPCPAKLLAPTILKGEAPLHPCKKRG